MALALTITFNHVYSYAHTSMGVIGDASASAGGEQTCNIMLQIPPYEFLIINNEFPITTRDFSQLSLHAIGPLFAEACTRPRGELVEP